MLVLVVQSGPSGQAPKLHTRISGLDAGPEGAGWGWSFPQVPEQGRGVGEGVLSGATPQGFLEGPLAQQ